MLSYHGEVKLLDFGVAKLGGAHLTKTGEVKGKTAYMSPEQAMGDALDRRSDLYGVGAMLFELVTGRRMWSGETDLELLRQLALGEAPLLAEAAPDAPRALCDLHARLVAKKASGRPDTAAEVADALRACVGDSKEAARSSLVALLTETYGDEAREKRRELEAALEALSKRDEDPRSGEPGAVIAPAKAAPQKRETSRIAPWLYALVGAAIASAAVLVARREPTPTTAPTSSASAAPTQSATAAATQPVVSVEARAVSPTLDVRFHGSDVARAHSHRKARALGAAARIDHGADATSAPRRSMSTRIRFSAAFALGCCVAFALSDARARRPTPTEDDPSLAQYRERFKQGLDRYEANDVAGALSYWEPLYRDLGPSRGYRVGLQPRARVRSRGDLTRAAERYESFLEEVKERRASGKPVDDVVASDEAKARARIDDDHAHARAHSHSADFATSNPCASIRPSRGSRGSSRTSRPVGTTSSSGRTRRARIASTSTRKPVSSSRSRRRRSKTHRRPALP